MAFLQDGISLNIASVANDNRILVTALRRRLEYLHPVSGSGISTTIIKRRAQQITFNESGSVARRTENHRILNQAKLQRTITAVTSATTGSEGSACRDSYCTPN